MEGPRRALPAPATSPPGSPHCDNAWLEPHTTRLFNHCCYHSWTPASQHHLPSPRAPSSSPDLIDLTPSPLEEDPLDDNVTSPAASPLDFPHPAPAPPLMTSLLHLPGRPLTLADFPSPSPDYSMSSTPGSPYQRRFPPVEATPPDLTVGPCAPIGIWTPPPWRENTPAPNGTRRYLPLLPPRSLTATNRFSRPEGRFRSSRHYSELSTIALTQYSSIGNGRRPI